MIMEFQITIKTHISNSQTQVPMAGYIVTISAQRGPIGFENAFLDL
jgi:hypothetical protein